MESSQECLAALQAACELLQDPALLRGQQQAIKRLGHFTNSDDSPFWPAASFLQQLAAAPEPPLAQALEATAGALIRLSGWVAATAARRSGPAFTALEALHDAYSLESAVRIANGLVSAAVAQEAAWPLQLRYRLMAAAAALALQALPAAADAVDAYPPPAPGETEPDYERIGFRIYAFICYSSETLQTLTTLARQMDRDAGSPGSLGALLQATAASHARLLAGLRLVERTCRDICHNDYYDFLMARMIRRMATLLNSAHPGTCVHRLLRNHPGISASLLIGCSDLLQRAAAGMLPPPPAQQLSSGRVDLYLRDRAAWLEQLLNAAGALFAPVLAPSWPAAGASHDAATLHRHLRSLVSSMGRLFLPEHQEQAEQLVQAFESASSVSSGHGSQLLVATAQALARLAWHVARNVGGSSNSSSEPAEAAMDWRRLLHVSLVRALVDSAACLAAASCGEQPQAAEPGPHGSMQLVSDCFGTAATLWGSCLNYGWAGSSSLNSREAGPVLLTAANTSSRMRHLQRLSAPGQAAVAQAVAAPVAQFMEATIRAVGRLCQATGSTHADTQVTTPLLSACTLSLQALLSLGACRSSLPSTSAGRTDWRPLLQLLRSAGKLCCQVAGDAQQLFSSDSCHPYFGGPCL